MELPVCASLQTTEETAVAVVAGGEAVEIVVARERAAEMRADIEAGPVVDRRGIGRRFVVIGAGTEIGTDGRGRRAQCEQRNGRKQNLLHSPNSNTKVPSRRAVRAALVLQIARF
ncbi:hypothetical protein ACVWYH_002994 [Bradyrhizobium sp. GM24.11]